MSETITRTDLKAILEEVFPDTSILDKLTLGADLLFDINENGNPYLRWTKDGNDYQLNVTDGMLRYLTRASGGSWTTEWELGNVTAPTVTITATTGTVKNVYARQYGKVMVLQVEVYNTSSVAGGSNVFQGTISNSAYRPVLGVGGAAYFGARAINGFVNTSGTITIRNASTTAVTTSSSDVISVSFTYIIN